MSIYIDAINDIGERLGVTLDYNDEHLHAKDALYDIFKIAELALVNGNKVIYAEIQSGKMASLAE